MEPTVQHPRALERAWFVEVETCHSRRNVAVVDCFSYGVQNKVVLALTVCSGLACIIDASIQIC